MFTDLSEGKATGFMYQHDARWADDYTSITLFDNGAEDGNWVEPFTRGIRVKIDQEAMTAELVNEYVNPNHIFGVSQGSLQVLDNGNVLMGYGNTGAMTEYAGNGTVLCDVHFGPQAWFGSGDIQSYRIYKFDWIGRPDGKPDVSILPSKDPESNLTRLFISWNGDTEVKRWVLEGTDEVERGAWRVIDDLEREGFETLFMIEERDPHFVRVKGLDKYGKYLTESDPWNWKQEMVRRSVNESLVGFTDWFVDLGFAAVKDGRTGILPTQVFDGLHWVYWSYCLLKGVLGRNAHLKTDVRVSFVEELPLVEGADITALLLLNTQYVAPFSDNIASSLIGDEGCMQSALVSFIFSAMNQ